MGFYTVDKFAQLDCIHFWWDMNTVRVHFMLETGQDKKLFLVLLDNAREKMLARVPDDMKSYVQQNVHVGNLYRLNDFNVEPTSQDYTRYHKFILLKAEFQIVFEKSTIVLPLSQPFCDFPLYPVVPSIEQIAGIQRGKHLTDVLGQVCYGHNVTYLGHDRVPSLQIYLLDWTGNVIQLVIIGKLLTDNLRIVHAIQKKSIVFVTRVKVIVQKPLNYLKATHISTFHFYPIMPEVFALIDRINMHA